jgi:DNA-binding transcriptional regulator YbjK
MPRLVDHDARRRELAHALWRVLRRDGLHAVSVRSVAAEAGWSAGALRHYFPSQDDLLGFALELVIERATLRVRPLIAQATGRDGALAVLAELLPLDAERREEFEVWQAFVVRAQVEPRLRPMRDAAEDATRLGVGHAVRLLEEAGELASHRNAELETDRLYALVDGLALHGTVRPERYPPAALLAILTAHVDELTD